MFLVRILASISVPCRPTTGAKFSTNLDKTDYSVYKSSPSFGVSIQQGPDAGPSIFLRIEPVNTYSTVGRIAVAFTKNQLQLLFSTSHTVYAHVKIHLLIHCIEKPIYVFPEKELRGPNFHIVVSVRIYIVYSQDQST